MMKLKFLRIPQTIVTLVQAGRMTAHTHTRTYTALRMPTRVRDFATVFIVCVTVS
jgi:hypothetical protein